MNRLSVVAFVIGFAWYQAQKSPDKSDSALLFFVFECFPEFLGLVMVSGKILDNSYNFDFR